MYKNNWICRSCISNELFIFKTPRLVSDLTLFIVFPDNYSIAYNNAFCQKWFKRLYVTFQYDAKDVKYSILSN